MPQVRPSTTTAIMASAGSSAKDCLHVHPAAVRPEEPPALAAERLVGPVGEKDGERQVRHQDVPARQPQAPEEGQVDEQGPGGSVAPECEHEPDERHDVPDGPLGEPWPQPEAAEQGGRRDEREDPDVARHLGQVVVREEGRLAERAGAAQQVRHQHQQQPPVRERPRVEQGHRARPALGRADDGQAGHPLHRAEADAENQARGHRARGHRARSRRMAAGPGRRPRRMTRQAA